MMPETIATVAMPNNKRWMKMRSMAPFGVDQRIHLPARSTILARTGIVKH
jgi:hypothetical protein